MEKVDPPRRPGEPAPPETGLPWAVALNVTDDRDEITVTLLTLSVVDELLRLTGLLRVRSRSELRIATIPSLELDLPDGTAVRLLDARTQPHGRVSWVSWTYDRPVIIPDRLEARIDRIELEHRVGGTARLELPGPWTFSFSVRPPTTVDGTVDPDRGGRKA